MLKCIKYDTSGF